MTDKSKKEKPKTVEEALGSKMKENQPVPEPTQDEIVAKALSDANVEDRLVEVSPPQEVTIPPTKPMTIPASSRDPQPVTPSSSLESQAPPQKERIEVWVDGHSGGNRGPAAIGVIVKRGGKLIKSFSERVGDGDTTVNQAEYVAVIAGLELACVLDTEIKHTASFFLFTDSELVANQLNGLYSVRNGNLRPLYERANELWGHLSCAIVYIPGEENQEAHDLAAAALHEPNEETVKAIKESERGENLKSFETTEELFADLNDSAEVDIDLQTLKDFVRGSGFNISWVELHLASLSSMPRMMPSITLWDIPNSIDVPNLVLGVLMTEGYLDNIWPHLKLLMGSSAGNTSWTASVACTVALFDAIKILPFTVMDEVNDNT